MTRTRQKSTSTTNPPGVTQTGQVQNPRYAFATAAVVRASYSFGAEQSWEGSTTAFGRSRRPPSLLPAVANQQPDALQKQQRAASDAGLAAFGLRILRAM